LSAFLCCRALEGFWFADSTALADDSQGFGHQSRAQELVPSTVTDARCHPYQFLTISILVLPHRHCYNYTMKPAIQRFVSKCDPIQKIFLFLMVASLAVYYAGFLLNAGEGWPFTRDGINLFWACAWTGSLYSILKYLLAKVGVKSKTVSLIIAVPLALILFIMLVGFALSGVGI
jgi:hypothetical protein